MKDNKKNDSRVEYDDIVHKNNDSYCMQKITQILNIGIANTVNKE